MCTSKTFKSFANSSVIIVFDFREMIDPDDDDDAQRCFFTLTPFKLDAVSIDSRLFPRSNVIFIVKCAQSTGTLFVKLF